MTFDVPDLGRGPVRHHIRSIKMPPITHVDFHLVIGAPPPNL